VNAQGWADRINTDVQRSVAAILKVGQDLIAAKAELSHGAWERMFTGYKGKSPVERPILFSVRTAERLMYIAKHPVLTKSANVSLLPPDRSTLYELAALDTKILSSALKDGRIHPGMELKDVGRLYQAAGEKVPARFVKHRGTAREQYAGGYYASTDLQQPEEDPRPKQKAAAQTLARKIIEDGAAAQTASAAVRKRQLLDFVGKIV
jgi:hypothetical protein